MISISVAGAEISRHSSWCFLSALLIYEYILLSPSVQSHRGYCTANWSFCVKLVECPFKGQGICLGCFLGLAEESMTVRTEHTLLKLVLNDADGRALVSSLNRFSFLFPADVKLSKRRQPFVPYALRNHTGCTMWFATLTTTPTR